WATTYSRRGLLKAFGVAGAAAALTPAALSAAPGGGIVPASVRRPNASTLQIARGQPTDSLDPHKKAPLLAPESMSQSYDSLIYLDEKGTVHPGLATEWTFSSDNLAVTYKLRDGIKFHDGTPFDANIVKETVARHLDKATASPTSYMLGPLDSIEVVDPLTVTYKYKALFAPMFVG